MKRTAIFLLTLSSLAFGQKFQDVTAKGAPVSLSVKHDYADMGPYAAVRNNSSKGILLMFSIVKTTDDCLVGDAKDAGVATIDLAKKRLAAAQEWQASGVLLMRASVL